MCNSQKSWWFHYSCHFIQKKINKHNLFTLRGILSNMWCVGVFMLRKTSKYPTPSNPLRIGSKNTSSSKWVIIEPTHCDQMWIQVPLFAIFQVEPIGTFYQTHRVHGFVVAKIPSFETSLAFQKKKSIKQTTQSKPIPNKWLNLNMWMQTWMWSGWLWVGALRDTP